MSHYNTVSNSFKLYCAHLTAEPPQRRKVCDKLQLVCGAVVHHLFVTYVNSFECTHYTTFRRCFVYFVLHLKATMAMSINSNDLDEEFNIEMLISAVEKRPPLYDITSKEYSDRSIKQRLWGEVCQNMFTRWNELMKSNDEKKVRTFNLLLLFIFTYKYIHLLLKFLLLFNG